MKTIVIFVLVLSLIRIGARLYALSYRAYPRTVQWSKGEDYFSLLCTTVLAVWCGWALLA